MDPGMYHSQLEGVKPGRFAFIGGCENPLEAAQDPSAVQTLTDPDQPLLQFSAQVSSPGGWSHITSKNSFNLLVSLHIRWVSIPLLGTMCGHGHPGDGDNPPPATGQ